MENFRRHTKKVLVGIVGGVVTLVGLILIPYPGPGWLIVFGGLALLATEFEFAARWLAFLKEKYEAWVTWLKRQTLFIRTIVLALTGIVVLVTLWVCNAFGVIVDITNVPFEWAKSPLVR